MAEAMVRGLLDRHLVPPSHVLVTGPRRERRAELAKTYGVKALASNAEAAADAHVVVLSVKPQVLATVMRELRGKLDEESSSSPSSPAPRCVRCATASTTRRSCARCRTRLRRSAWA